MHQYEVMASNQESYSKRWSLFGDVPTRMMLWAVRSFPGMPRWFEWFLMNASVGVIFLLARKQRRAIRSNLNVIHGGLSWWRGTLGAYQVICNFGWTYLDSMRARFGQKSITWELVGEEVFHQIRDSKEAAILLTTHTGNYDLAACLFAEEFGRTLHTIRMPERTEELQKMRQREFEEKMRSYPFFKVHYNTSENLLGIELARLMSDGELLALQCDRVIGDVVAMEVPLADDPSLSMKIPKGPMTLAVVGKCPCYPLYVVRDRYRHYRVIFEPALEVDPSVRRPREMDYAKCWTERLLAFLKTHSHEWFVFEEVFVKRDKEKGEGV